MQFIDYMYLYIMIKRDIAPINETSEQTIERLNKGIDVRDAKIETLSNELIALRRMLFGHKSERFLPEDPNQLILAFEGMESLPEEQVIETEEVSYTRNKAVKIQPVRNAIPESIRREEVVI